MAKSTTIVLALLGLGLAASGGRRSKKSPPLDSPDGPDFPGGGETTKPRIGGVVILVQNFTDAGVIVDAWGNAFAGLGDADTFQLAGFAYDFAEWLRVDAESLRESLVITKRADDVDPEVIEADILSLDFAGKNLEDAAPLLRAYEQACCVAGANDAAKLAAAMSGMGTAVKHLIAAAYASAARLDEPARERAHELALGPYGTGEGGPVAWEAIMHLVLASVDSASPAVRAKLEALNDRAPSW